MVFLSRVGDHEGGKILGNCRTTHNVRHRCFYIGNEHVTFASKSI